MNAIDPRDLGDRALFAYLLFGDLPTAGWSGRRRAIVARLLRVAGMAALAAVVTIAVLGVIVLVWAGSLPA